MSLPYMRLYPGDYLADTTHLTTEEHGAYMLLIMAYWQHGGPLPADDTRLMRITRTNKRRWMAIKDSLFEFFVLNSENQLVHKRVQAELDAAADKCAKLQAAGRASGAKRANKCSTNDEQMLPECSPHNEQTLVYPNPNPEEKNSLSTPLTPHAADGQQPEAPPMLSLEWQELRAYYDEHARTEGPMDGYGDYLAAKGAKAWPGQTAVYDAIDRWKASGQWDEDGVPRFAPGLGKFIARRLWNAHPTPKPKREPPRGYGGTSQPPRATTQAQVISQSKDRIARDVAARRGIDVDAVLGKTTGIAGGNQEWASGQHARLPVGERN